jgi:hypothetical protein
LAHPNPAKPRRRWKTSCAFHTDAWDLSVDLEAGLAAIVVIDAGCRDAYIALHIPGAVSFPHREMNSETTARLNRGKIYVVYGIPDGVTITRFAEEAADTGAPKSSCRIMGLPTSCFCKSTQIRFCCSQVGCVQPRRTQFFNAGTVGPGVDRLIAVAANSQITVRMHVRDRAVDQIAEHVMATVSSLSWSDQSAPYVSVFDALAEVRP